MDYCAAFIQLYREEARYLERTAPWIERVGLAHIVARIVDDEPGREALRARFLYSQSFSQDDPWAQRAERSEEHTSELQSLMRISYAVFCLKKKTYNN